MRKSKKYLEWIRQKNCIVTDSNVGVVAHHVRIGFYGTGIKPDDYRCLPLTHTEHEKLHAMGEKSYWDKHNIFPEREIVHNLVNWLAIKAIKSGSSEAAIQDLIDTASKANKW